MTRIGMLFLFAAAALCAETFTLTVNLKGFRSDKGMVAVALFDQAPAFPTKPDKALAGQRAPVVNGSATVVFKDLPGGVYAVAAFHDVNNNGKLDANFLGIPKEPTGASNDAKGRMGPPSFQNAQFRLAGDQSVNITIQ